MTRLLEQTVRNGGTLRGVEWEGRMHYRDENGKKYVMPAGGKTGTTQNWQAVWTRMCPAAADGRGGGVLPHAGAGTSRRS